MSIKDLRHNTYFVFSIKMKHFANIAITIFFLTTNSIINAEENQSIDRAHFIAKKSDIGTSIRIPEDTVRELCGDGDGCEVRLGMSNWDNSGKVASGFSLFYYNNNNRAWRASSKNRQGVNANGTSENIVWVYSCIFTDGQYVNFKTPNGDASDGSDNDLWLLSWNKYEGAKADDPERKADCLLTLID